MISAFLLAPAALAAQSPTPTAPDAGAAITAEAAADDTAIVVTARRRAENVQDVPVAISVVDGATLDSKGVFNISRLTQLQPALQFFSTPRSFSMRLRLSWQR